MNTNFHSLRTEFIGLLLVCFLGLRAQGQDRTEMKIVKSDAIEMTKQGGSSTEAAATDLRYDFTGAHDRPLAHPDCASMTSGQREQCTAEAVLQSIKDNSTYDPATIDAPLEQDKDLEITFAVNEFGDVKNIQIQYSGDVRITRSVIQALYALPKFVPAQKGGIAVGSTCRLTYPYSAIF